MWIVALVSIAVPCGFANGSAFGFFLAILPTSYVSSWACGLDFKYRCDQFLCSLPVARRTLVAYRYLSALAAWALSFAVSLPIWFLIDAFGPGVSVSYLPMIAVVSLAASVLMQAVYLGAYYVVGYQNARWAMVAVFAVIGSIAALFGGAASPAPGGSQAAYPLTALLDSGPVLGAAALALAFALYALSYAVASAAYGRKEF